jgi:hypothetical protein
MRTPTLGLATTLLTSLLACGNNPGPVQPTNNTSAQVNPVTTPGNNPGDKPVYAPETDDPDAPVTSGNDGSWGIQGPQNREYQSTIERVVGMVDDEALQRRVARRGLSLVNVMWEDTGRSVGSAVGPNISDFTLQVRRREQNRFASNLLPVIRHPNFSDRTGDIPADRFFVRVGNQRNNAAGTPGSELETVALTTLLQNIGAYSTDAASILGTGSLLAQRDSHFLVSSQAVFLPIPKEGKAEFNPVLFNYQSSRNSPAVLSILVTRQGTTMRVIENRSEEGSSSNGLGQELYFNNRGQRAAFTAERKSEVEAKIAAQGGPKNEDERSALQKGADSIFLIQVPLVVVRRRMPMAMPPAPPMAGGAAKPMAKAAAAPAASAAAESKLADKSDVEQAVIGHGPNLGKFREGFGNRLVRDTRFPIRVTVQFYKATSNGVVSDADLDGIAANIGQVFEHADSVGSLVLPEGDKLRPTAWTRIPRTWFAW